MTRESSVERGRDPTAWVGFDPEFVVASPHVLHESVAAHEHACGVVECEAAHRTERDLSRPWSDSIRLFAYCSVLWNAPGMSSSTTARSVQARSVTTSAGWPWLPSAVAKNRRAAWVSRRGET